MDQVETFHHKSPFIITSTIKEKMFLMKKNKRIISLAIALVMMFSFMAMSASAATVEVPVVQPKASTCPQCGNPSLAWYKTTYPSNYYDYEIVGELFQDSGLPTYHAHYYVPATEHSRCATCGNQETYTHYVEYCPYGG